MNINHAFDCHVVVSIVAINLYGSCEGAIWDNILAQNEGLTNSFKSHIMGELVWVGINAPADIDVQWTVA